ncbi:hypothetical protein GW17_00011108 [Ensete ventricosum]|nr:hypothetical protein GW17_00011108 [Ensete ventricosum]
MAIIRSSLSFLLGAACGVYAAQNYSVPNLRKLADTAMVFAKHYEESSRNYAAKDIRFGVEARASMLQGVEDIDDAVKVTIGPKWDWSKYGPQKSRPKHLFGVHHYCSPFRSVPPGVSGTYRSDRIPIRRSSASGRYCRNRRLPARERGNEAMPHLPVRGRGVASSPRAGTRCCLISPCGDEVLPHLPARERGNASSSSGRTRRHLVFLHGDESPPRSPTRRRGVVLLRGEVRRHLVFLHGDESSPRLSREETRRRSPAR